MSKIQPSRKNLTKWSVVGAIVVLCAAGVLSVAGARRLSESAQLVTHTVEVEESIDQISDHLVDAENSRRGYYLFHSENDLQLMQASIAALPVDVATVRNLSADNPHQQERLDQLEPLLNRRIELLKQANTESDKNIANAAVQTRIHDEAEPITRQIRVILEDMNGEEQGLLVIRQHRLQQTNKFTILTVVGAGILAIVLFSIASLMNQREITQRLAVEKEMRRQRAMLRSVLNSMGEGVAVVDETADFTLFNPAAERLLGLQSTDRNAKEWATHFHAYKADQKTAFPVNDLPLYKVLRDQVAEPAEVWVPDAQSPTHSPSTTSPQQGSWIRVSARPLESEEGFIKGGVAVFGDVSQQKNAETALRKAQENLQAALHDAERRERESAQLNQLSELLQSCHSLEESFKFIEHSLQQLFPYGIGGSVCLTSASRNLVESVGTWGEPASATVFSPDECWALRRGRLHRSDEKSPVLRCPHLSANATDRVLCIPLAAQGETLGVISINANPEAVDNQGKTEADAAARFALAERAGQQISLALANLQLRETLRNQSIRDALTGLYNRRYMEESLARELHRAKRKKSALAILMIDVDHFKRFNDTMGHETGDLLLRKFGEYLRSNIRADDIACRYGGEEFALILPDAGLDGVLVRAEALREGAAQLTIDSGIRPAMHITISAGIAIFPDNGLSGEELLRTADAALYQAKSAGRNQVVVAKIFQSTT
jgi:diguanylate cyclase (GGDEF)-like protein